jgi:class 3 adenylate cyclase
MRIWNRLYSEYIKLHFRSLVKDLKSKLDQIVKGRVVPSAEFMPIGSARKLDAAVLFFDIRGSSRLPSETALYTLNIVIPTIMRIIYDHDGYVEKNTGDGVMAIFTDSDTKKTCKAALQSALVCFYALKQEVNPHLIQSGYQTVNARIGIDFGEILFSRIGLPHGTARQDRNFLTAIGPAANIACSLQEQAGTNEIWVGNAIRGRAPQEWQTSFTPVYPSDWPWTTERSSEKYPAWRFDATLPIVSASTYLTSPAPSLPLPQGLTWPGNPLPPPAPSLPLPSGLWPYDPSIPPRKIEPPSPFESLIDTILKKKPPS